MDGVPNGHIEAGGRGDERFLKPNPHVYTYMLSTIGSMTPVREIQGCASTQTLNRVGNPKSTNKEQRKEGLLSGA